MSTAPFSDAVNAMSGGTWGGWAVALAALVQMTGCLNGWTLLSAQTPYAAAQDGLFPAAFARRVRGVPTVGVTVALASLLTVYNCMSGSAKVFEILAAVAAAFSTWLIVGAGFAAVYQGVLFLFAGVVVYAVLAARRQRTA